MNCPHCGLLNRDAARCCARCALLLVAIGVGSGVAAGATRGTASRARPVRPAQEGAARPAPRAARLADGGIGPLRPGSAARPTVLVAAATTGNPLPPLRAQGAIASDASHRLAAAQALAWSVGGLLLCVALLFGSQQTLRPLLPWLQELAVSGLDGLDEAGDLDDQAEPPAEAEPQAEAAMDPGELADAINAELRRVGVDSVDVQVSADGTATLDGRLASESDRAALLEWLRTVPGIRAIDDGLEIEAAREEPVVPVPAPPPPPPRAAAPGQPRPTEPPPAAPQRRSTESPTAARGEAVAPSLPPPPDAGAIARAVQREVAQLGLSGITVEVDPSSLQVTLRGTANDAARKARAVAAARAATPGGRVRDLVFVVEE